MSWQAAAIRFAARRLVRPSLTRPRTPDAARLHFERGARWMFRAPPLTLTQPIVAGGVAGLRVSNRPSREGVILYFHGGAYMMGSPATHAAMLATIAGKTGLESVLPDYRLAPEHPFPAAFEDAVAAFEGLVAQGHDPRRIILGGDSAGGGLAIALLAHLCVTDRRPAGLFAFSPWTDLTLTGASLITNAAREQIMPAHRLTEVRAMILGSARPADAADPRLSPLHALFPSVPPVLITAAETEILRDDALRMRGRLPDAEIRLGGDLPHVWPILHNWLPEARATLDQTAQFILSCLPSSTES